LVTASDVLHSWAVPELGIKIDAIPGRLNQFVTVVCRPGRLYGQCSELCGVSHGFMPIVVDAVGWSTFQMEMRNLTPTTPGTLYDTALAHEYDKEKLAARRTERLLRVSNHLLAIEDRIRNFPLNLNRRQSTQINTSSSSFMRSPIDLLWRERELIRWSRQQRGNYRYMLKLVRMLQRHGLIKEKK
jgi:hypothetical protein